MDARQVVTRFAHRAATSAVVAALALGLSVSAFTPAAANAAPLNPAKGPSYSADLTIVDWRIGGFGAGEHAVIPLGIYNNGSSTATPVRVKIVSAVGFSNLTAYGPGWSCVSNGLIGPGQLAYTCDLASIAGGDSKGLTVEADVVYDEFQTMTFTVDPQNAVRESNERNNQVTSNY